MGTALARRTVLAAFAVMLCGGIGHASEREDDDHDHDRARRALEQAQVRPLVEILTQVRDRLGGEVVGVEFERENGRYVYEFKVVTPAGRLREVYVDALTAEILKSGDD